MTAKLSSVPPANDDGRIAGVTFRYSDCNNRVLHGALEKLDEYTGWSAKDLSRWNKIKNAFDIKSKEVSHLFKKLVDKHANHEPVMRKDEATGEMVPVLKPNGKPRTRPITIPSGRGTRDFDYKDRQAFNVDYKTLMSEEFKIEAYRLLTDDLHKAGLTPKEIRTCGKILTDVDPELVLDSPIFDEDDEEDMEDDEEPAPIPSSSVDQAPEAPNTDAAASTP